MESYKTSFLVYFWFTHIKTSQKSLEIMKIWFDKNVQKSTLARLYRPSQIALFRIKYTIQAIQSASARVLYFKASQPVAFCKT